MLTMLIFLERRKRKTMSSRHCIVSRLIRFDPRDKVDFYSSAAASEAETKSKKVAALFQPQSDCHVLFLCETKSETELKLKYSQYDLWLGCWMPSFNLNEPSVIVWSDDWGKSTVPKMGEYDILECWVSLIAKNGKHSHLACLHVRCCPNILEVSSTIHSLLVNALYCRALQFITLLTLSVASNILDMTISLN